MPRREVTVEIPEYPGFTATLWVNYPKGLQADLKSGDTARLNTALAKLEGSLKMKRSFYPGRDDYKPINATLVGFLEFSPAARRVESMALVTEKASYGDEEFGAGMHSVSSAPAPEK